MWWVGIARALELPLYVYVYSISKSFAVDSYGPGLSNFNFASCCSTRDREQISS